MLLIPVATGNWGIKILSMFYTRYFVNYNFLLYESNCRLQNLILSHFSGSCASHHDKASNTAKSPYMNVLNPIKCVS